MSIFNKIVGAGAAEAVAAVGQAVDRVVTSDQERGLIKQELTGIITKYSETMTGAAKEVVLAEANGNRLQRNWRPMLMLSFGFIVIYEYFIANVFGLPKAGLSENFWDVMELGLGGYVIGRSAEKITERITSNLDKLPGKRGK